MVSREPAKRDDRGEPEELDGVTNTKHESLVVADGK